MSSFQALTICWTPSGVNSDGFSTTAQPAIRAGIASPIERISGKFHGLIRPTTGWGRYWTRILWVAVIGE